MKKTVIIILAIVALLLVLFLAWRYFETKKEVKTERKKETLAKEQEDLLYNLGNGKIEFTDPELQTKVVADFSNKTATSKNGSVQTIYQIKDALQPINLDQGIEKEYPLIVSASYPSKKLDFLIIAHEDNGKFSASDLKAIGPSDRVEDIHLQDKEVIIDAKVPDSAGDKQSVILTYTISEGMITPGYDNVDISKIITIEKPQKKPAAASSSSGAGGKVALTFDDGPGTYTPSILEILKDNGVKATFFMIGENAAAHNDFVKQVAADGHLIGDHTYTHPQLSKLSYDQQYQELSKAKSTIIGILPDTQIKYYRPPYGDYNADTDRAADSLNLKRILWNVDTRDWSGKTAADITASVLSSAKSGSIVLMHDGVANSKETAKALPDIIAELRAKGFSLVTIAEL